MVFSGSAASATSLERDSLRHQEGRAVKPEIWAGRPTNTRAADLSAE